MKRIADWIYNNWLGGNKKAQRVKEIAAHIEELYEHAQMIETLPDGKRREEIKRADAFHRLELCVIYGHGQAYLDSLVRQMRIRCGK